MDGTRQWFERQTGIILCAAVLIFSQYQWYGSWRVNAVQAGIDGSDVVNLYKDSINHEKGSAA